MGFVFKFSKYKIYLNLTWQVKQPWLLSDSKSYSEMSSSTWFKPCWTLNSLGLTWISVLYHRADSRLAPSQWETSLQSNAVSHWLGANIESALDHHLPRPQLLSILTLALHSTIHYSPPNLIHPEKEGEKKGESNPWTVMECWVIDGGSYSGGGWPH